VARQRHSKKGVPVTAGMEYDPPLPCERGSKLPATQGASKLAYSKRALLECGSLLTRLSLAKLASPCATTVGTPKKPPGIRYLPFL
jgi:hypothetical protein